MTLLRQILGVLSLALGLALLGECAAHTAHALVAQGTHRDLAFRLLKDTFFSLGSHQPAYLILFGAGAVLSLLGVALTGAWALPFFMFSGLCFAVLGGMAVGRVVLQGGAEASLVQDGISGLGRIFPDAYAVGAIGDPVMVLGLGVFGLLTGLFLTHWRKAPAPQPAVARGGRTARRAPPPEEEVESFTPAATPANPAEAKADTSVDLDLSPDLETSEVHVPEEPPSFEEPMPEPPPLEEPVEDLPPSIDTPADLTPPMTEEAPPLEEPLPEPPPLEEPANEEAPADLPEPPEWKEEEAPPPAPLPEPELQPNVGLSIGGVVMGLASAGASGALILAFDKFPPPVAGQVFGGGVAAGLAGLGLAILSRPLKGLGWTAVGMAAAGLGGAGTLLALGIRGI